MKKSISNWLSPLAASLVLSGTAIAAHAGDDQQAGFTLSPSIGYLTHEKLGQSLGDNGTATIAAGYQFASPWALELAYSITSPYEYSFEENADIAHLRLDSLYHFAGDGKTQPYAVFGAGYAELDRNLSKEDDRFVNAGIGMKYALTDVLSLRSDIRVLQTFDEHAMQFAFNLGLHFAFGGNANNSKKVVAAPMPMDSDKDGVYDANDNCPNTPAGVRVDAQGCELVLDDDKDGVANANDKCPDSELGAKVDSEGCYVILKENITVSLNIQFANNSSDIIDESDPQIAELAQFMTEYPQTNVVINGYTDDRGAASYNQSLSLRRAEAVANLIAEKFSLKAERLSAIGHGEADPIASNDTAAGRAMNRRVEATINAQVEKIAK